MQCFGYCMVDTDQALRDQVLKYDAGYRKREDFKLDVVT
jgi:hypothetical protein